MPPKPNRPITWLSKYLALALTLPASVIGGYLVASLVDRLLHWPWLRPLGIVLGMMAGIYQILRELSRDDRKTKPPQ